MNAVTAPMVANSWPELRDELVLYPGPESPDGAPSWSLHDPVRNLYFRLDWLTFEILCRWSLGDTQRIVQSLGRETTLQIDADTVQAVLQFLYQHELVKCSRARQSAQLEASLARRKTSALTWLLHRYLFFRVPLWHPDRWLERTLHRVSFLGSAAFTRLTLLVLVLGLFEVSRQWDSFSSTLLDLFSLQGLIAYALTLVCVKFVHELGHAYVAKHLGCRVPTIGVAFLVMFPMAYTDVNDAWKLPSRRDRLRVGAAGIRTELTLAIWATLAWTLFPDGVLRSAAFLLATTTWISTLLVNLSPFMRFDGYFLLMDWLDLPNLHQRAFALARWDLRKRLFGFADPAPELFAARRQRWLILFAWCTWLYRVTVFMGIAWMVYLAFPKPLGPLLAAIELVWFILRPLKAELVHWVTRKEEIVKSGRSLRTLLVLCVLLGLVFLPWDSRIHTQAVLKPEYREQQLAPGEGQVVRVLKADGAEVEAGELLLELHSPDLAFKRRAAEARLQGLEQQLNASRITPELHQRQAVILSERQALQAEIAGIEQLQQRYRITAARAGVIRWSQPDLGPGLWVAESEELGVLVEPTRWQVRGYLPETERSRVQPGDSARFFLESGEGSVPALRVSRIDSDSSRVLGDALLASTRGGELLVREQGNQLYPEIGLYAVTLQPEAQAQSGLTDLEQVELRGHLVIYGERRSWAWHYWRAASALLRRELGF